MNEISNQKEESSSIYIILIAAVAALGGFLFGFDSGVFNGTVKGLESAFNAEDIGSGFNVASMLIGCAIGVFLQVDFLIVMADVQC